MEMTTSTTLHGNTLSPWIKFVHEKLQKHD